MMKYHIIFVIGFCCCLNDNASGLVHSNSNNNLQSERDGKKSEKTNQNFINCWNNEIDGELFETIAADIHRNQVSFVIKLIFKIVFSATLPVNKIPSHPPGTL